MKLRIIAFAALYFLCLGLVPAFALNGSAPLQRLILAEGANSIISASVFVAYEKGFFKQEGIEVSILRFLSGKEALETVVSGKADLATVADHPIALGVMKGAKIYVLATLSNIGNIYGIVLRKDHGVSSLQDLKGKRIGVVFGTNAQFILDSFLLYHHIPRNRVTLVNLQANEIVKALSLGQVQAVATWEPFLSELQERLGNNALFYYDEKLLIYKMTWNLAAGQDFVRRNPEAVKKILRALLKAEAFIHKNRQEARQIVIKSLKSDSGGFTRLWPAYRSNISLSPLLIENLESQSRWAIRNKLFSDREIPNFLQYIFFEGLESVNPKAVTIVH